MVLINWIQSDKKTVWSLKYAIHHLSILRRSACQKIFQFSSLHLREIQNHLPKRLRLLFVKKMMKLYIGAVGNKKLENESQTGQTVCVYGRGGDFMKEFGF